MTKYIQINRMYYYYQIKGRNRSRSGPSLGSRQNIQQSPPLVPNNDSSLQPPLLAQILTNNSKFYFL